jgi:hypothetical protein
MKLEFFSQILEKHVKNQISWKFFQREQKSFMKLDVRTDRHVDGNISFSEMFENVLKIAKNQMNYKRTGLILCQSASVATFVRI